MLESFATRERILLIGGVSLHLTVVDTLILRSLHSFEAAIAGSRHHSLRSWSRSIFITLIGKCTAALVHLTGSLKLVEAPLVGCMPLGGVLDSLNYAVAPKNWAECLQSLGNFLVHLCIVLVTVLRQFGSLLNEHLNLV